MKKEPKKPLSPAHGSPSQDTEIPTDSSPPGPAAEAGVTADAQANAPHSDSTTDLPDPDKTAAMQGSARLTSLGRFPIDEKVGEGGMGIVYRAYDPDLHRVVALKRIHPRYEQDAEYARRFLAEARAVAAVAHPNIAQIYSIHAHDQETPAYFVMEYVDGPTLAEMVRSSGPLSSSSAIDIATQVARGLQAAYARGLVHHDINPKNILLTQRGEVKLVDFGLARRVRDPLPFPGEGSVAGTPHYLSPEQARGWSVDQRADFYSLGCTLFFMLTGKEPYSGKSIAEVIEAHRSAPVARAANVRPDVPEEFDRLLGRLLAKRPEERVQTYDDLLAELARLWNKFGDRRVPVARTPAFRIVALFAFLALAAAVPIVYEVLAGESREEIAPERIFGPHIYCKADGMRSGGLDYDFSKVDSDGMFNPLHTLSIQEPAFDQDPAAPDPVLPALRPREKCLRWANYSGPIVFPSFQEFEQVEVQGLRFRGALDFELRLGGDDAHPGTYLRVFFSVGKKNQVLCECRQDGERVELIEQDRGSKGLEFSVQEGCSYRLRLARAGGDGSPATHRFLLTLEQELDNNKMQERARLTLRLPSAGVPRGALSMRAEGIRDPWEVSLTRVIIRGQLDADRLRRWRASAQ